MVSRVRGLLAGAAAAALLAVTGASGIVAAPPQSRTISLYNIHTKEALTVRYKKDGKYIAAAMDRIDWVMRDWRKDEKTRMDPALIDLLWEIHTELGSREPIHINSGYRSRATNEMLRKTVGGQASESRHILGKAADVYFPDVPVKKLRYSALIRERGGVGYYPTSATPFVHVDTDRVRHWPRLPRYELALLFPNGRSQHVPADGGPITREDVRLAQARHKDLALQVAEFHADRKALKRATLVANAGGPAPIAARRPDGEPKVALSTPPAPPPRPAPKLVSEPRPVQRPSRPTTGPTEEERRQFAKLAALASLPAHASGPTPGLRRAPDPAVAFEMESLTGGAAAAGLVAPGPTAPGRAPRIAAIDRLDTATAGDSLTDFIGSAWVTAPAYDDEHPEEISYRPFSLAPLMTTTPSPDDPELTRLVHPDAARTLELLDQAGTMPPMRLRPGQQVAELLSAQQFTGAAVAVNGLFDPPEPARDGLASPRVRTSGN